MPVPAYPGPNTSTGNGVTTVFAYSFRILAEADLRVSVDGVVKTLTTHYTISGVGDAAGGNVTFLTAPANGADVVIERSRAYTRTTDYQRNGAFDEQTVDADFDAAIMLIQQLREITRRIPQLAAGTTLLDLALPSPGGGEYLRWNAGGTALETVDLVGQLTGTPAVSAFMETMLDDATAAGARATLGLDVIVRNVLDFGATGDGAADDSAAIAAAIADLPTNGGCIYFPEGSYFLGTTGISTTKDGLVLVGASEEGTKLIAGNVDLLTLTGCDWFGLSRLTLEGDNTNTGKRAIVATNLTRSTIRDVMIRKCKGSAIDISGASSLCNVIENVKVAAGTSPDAAARAIKAVGGNALIVTNCYLNGYATMIEESVDSFTSVSNTIESCTTGIVVGNGNFVSVHDKFYTVSGNRYSISGNYDTTIVTPRNCTQAQIDVASMTDKKYLHLVGIEAQGSPVNTIAEPGLQILRGTVDTTGAGTIIEGLGFTKSVNATGDITITFSTAFSDIPTVTAIADRTVGATAVAVVLNATSTTTTCRLKRVDAANAPEDGYINFTVAGPA